MFTVTKSLPLHAGEWPLSAGWESATASVLTGTIKKFFEVGKRIFRWSKQEHLFSIPLGKINELMLFIGWLYSEGYGGFEKLPLITPLSLHLVVLHMISEALWKSWQHPNGSIDDSNDVSGNGVIVCLLLKRPDIFYFSQQLPRILQPVILHKIKCTLDLLAPFLIYSQCDAYSITIITYNVQWGWRMQKIINKPTAT